MSTTAIDVAREALEQIARGDTFGHPNAVEKVEAAREALDTIKRIEVEAEAAAAVSASASWLDRVCARIADRLCLWSDPRVPPPPPARQPIPPAPPRRKVTGWELEINVGDVRAAIELRQGPRTSDADMRQAARVLIETITRMAPPGAVCPPAPGGPGRAGLQFTIGPISDKGNRTMLVLKATQKVLLSLVFTDGKGNPATVDGAPKWDVSAPEVGQLTVADDGLSASLAAGSPTTGQVNVTADADLGDGIKPITGVLDVQILAGDAALIAIASGAPEDQ